MATMAHPQEEAAQQKLRAQLEKMSPEDRERALEAGKARLQLIHEAKRQGLPVSTPEEIKASLKRLVEKARKSV